MNPSRIDTASLLAAIRSRRPYAANVHIALNRLNADLKDVSALAREAADATSDAALDRSRARIDQAVRTITTASDRALSGPPRLDAATLTHTNDLPTIPRPWTSFSSVSDKVEQVRGYLYHRIQDPLEVMVDVTASAQHGGFYLSFGDESINLSAALARFRIEIGGNTGVQELSFASGTSVADIAAGINSISARTGVVARLSGDGARIGTGIALHSDDVGENRFVSVRVRDSGSINTARPYAGAYRLQDDNENEASRSSSVRFSSLSNVIRDFGQNVEARVNDWRFDGTGRSLSGDVWTWPIFFAQFRLTLAAAQTLGRFHAFTIDPTAAALTQGGESASKDPGAASDSETPVQPPEPSRETLANVRAEILSLRGGVSTNNEAGRVLSLLRPT